MSIEMVGHKYETISTVYLFIFDGEVKTILIIHIRRGFASVLPFATYFISTLIIAYEYSLWIF